MKTLPKDVDKQLAQIDKQIESSLKAGKQAVADADAVIKQIGQLNKQASSLQKDIKKD